MLPYIAYMDPMGYRCIAGSSHLPIGSHDPTARPKRSWPCPSVGWVETSGGQGRGTWPGFSHEKW